MIVAVISLAAVLAGGASAWHASAGQGPRSRREALGGGLLATGLMLLGAGLHSALTLS